MTDFNMYITLIMKEWLLFHLQQMSIDYQAKYLSFYIIITLITFIAFTGTRYSTLMQASEKKK